jgi:hypothetical protein
MTLVLEGAFLVVFVVGISLALALLWWVLRELLRRPRLR